MGFKEEANFSVNKLWYASFEIVMVVFFFITLGELYILYTMDLNVKYLIIQLLNKDISLKAVSKFLGHASVATTAQMYIHDEVDYQYLFSRDSI